MRTALVLVSAALLLLGCSPGVEHPGRLGPGGGNAITGTGSGAEAPAAPDSSKGSSGGSGGAPSVPEVAPADRGPSGSGSPSGAAAPRPGGFRLLSAGALEGALLSHSALSSSPADRTSLQSSFCTADPTRLVAANILLRLDGVEVNRVFSRSGRVGVVALGQSSTEKRARESFDLLVWLLENCRATKVGSATLDPFRVPASGGVRVYAAGNGSVGFVYAAARVGPTLVLVAERYAGPPDAAATLRVLEAQVRSYRSAAS